MDVHHSAHIIVTIHYMACILLFLFRALFFSVVVIVLLLLVFVLLLKVPWYAEEAHHLLVGVLCKDEATRSLRTHYVNDRAHNAPPHSAGCTPSVLPAHEA